MGVRKGVSLTRTHEERHAMSVRLPKVQHEQLQDIAEFYECSLNEALIHCINGTSISLFKSLEAEEKLKV